MGTNTENASLMRAGANLEGKLAFSGTVQLNCRFSGDISSDGTLIIGEQGKIYSDIRVAYLISSGEIRGNIYAERVELRSPGKLLGNIQAPVVVINKGAFFEGDCNLPEKAVDALADITDEVSVVDLDLRKIA